MPRHPEAYPLRRGTVTTVFSDAGSTVASDGATVQQWNDYTGLGYNAVQSSSSRRPVYSSSAALANFNPTITFDGSNDYLEFAAPTGVNIIDRESGTIYASGVMTKQKVSGFAGFHASMDYPGLHVFTSQYKLLFYTGGPGYQGLSTDPMPTTSYFIAGSGWQNGAGASASYAAATVSLNGTHVEYTGSQLNNANLSNSARNFRIGGDNNCGYFAGQLNEVLVYEDRLTPSQMDRVETYLAIKYGTTLADGTKNYVNSAGEVIWEAAANVGYNFNIAGIGRDNDGALYQKQSWSTNAGKQVLIGVGTLANTNQENTAELTNGQFLIWADNGENRALVVPIADIPNISHRFGAIWKVTNIGDVGTVRVAWPKGISNISLIQSTDAIFDASDVITPMIDNEIVINGIVYNYADVTLSNGQYFTFIGKAIAPGGVTEGLLMWHRADDGTDLPGPKDIWQDISGNNRDVKQTNNLNYRPTLITDATYTANSVKYSFNFNPFYYFDGSNDFFYNKNVPYFAASNSPGSIYGVMHNSTATGWRTPYGWGDDDPNLNRSSDNYYFYRNNGSAINTGNIGLRTKPAHIAAMLWRGTSNGVYLTVNGRTWFANTGIGTINSADNFAIGSEGYDLNGNGNEVFQGGISEVFAYTVNHQNSSGDELNRIYSYLAIKYGITLRDSAGAGPRSYLSSNSVIVWDGVANSDYHNNVAGIARDDNSGLHQKQSQSNEKGQQILIGTTGLANTNNLNGTGLNEGQFLVWGDNGLPKVPAVAISGVENVNFRFASVWKVQNTGDVGTVRVCWPTGLTNLTLIQGDDPTFATYSSSTLMSTNSIFINGVVYNYADVTFEDGEYFTLAAQLNGPGGVALDLRVWLRSDAGFSPEEWIDFSGEGNNFTQTNASRQPFLASKLYNFNPMVDFGGEGSAARFMVVPNGKPYSANGSNSTMFAVTLSKNVVNYSDIIGFGGTTTSASLANANNPVMTTQSRRMQLYPYEGPTSYDKIRSDIIYLDDISFTVGTPGIKFGKNGDTITHSGTVSASNARHASGAIVGAQPEERYGYIGELVCFERDITESEKRRVRSYLAIKYGITLAHSYIASDDVTIFWDYDADTTYNNNIAGIARDDYGSLNQRQSWSVNSASEVIISTPGLANSNATNSVMLSDMQALMWGDNGEKKGLAIDIDGIEGINKRFAAIWKVKNTNNVGTVRVAWPKGFENLSLIVSADEEFDSSDDVYPMDGVINLDGRDFVYADVTFDDGQYFTFGAYVLAPGGVSNNLTYWYRADMLVEALDEDSADVHSWTDMYSASAAHPIGTNPVPKRRVGAPTYFNFNPGLEFSEVTTSLVNMETYTVEALEFDIYTVTLPGLVAGSNGRIFSALVNDTDIEGSIAYWDGIGIMVDNRLERVTNTFGSRYLANPGGTWANDRPNLLYATFTDVNLGKVLNGSPTVATGTHSERGAMYGGYAFGNTVFLSNGSDNQGFKGHLGEVIIYGAGNNSPEERTKIETYLAIKYGITLHNSVNYTNSQNVVIWDATANTGYYNNVAGIGRDHVSALHQKQSRSQHNNTNNQVIIGVGEIAETNADNSFSLEDGQFLVWGDNGNTQAMTNSASTYTAFEYAGSVSNGRRMNRVWKAQNTGVNQEVLIRFPTASVGTTTLPDESCAEYVLIVADDPTFSTNLVTVPLTISEDSVNYDVRHTFQEGFSYFTFARVRPVNPGIVVLPTESESTSEYDDLCNMGDWTYFHRSGTPGEKLIAMADFEYEDLDSFAINIVTEGTEYDDEIQLTRLMPRITYVEDLNESDWGTGKVRIYYSQDELEATLVDGALTNGWFKFDGDPFAAIADIVSDGVFDSTKAIQLIPDAYGVEDGVNYVEFHNITSFSSFVFISSTFELSEVLDVDWVYFTANEDQGSVLLQWATGSEHNNKGFEIERSKDGRNWSNIGFVNSKTQDGNSSVALSYDFTDARPMKGNNFYRLKQVSLNGQVKYSEIRVVNINEKGVGLFAVPNPTQGSLTIKGLRNGNNNLVLVNAIGQVLLNVDIEDQSEYYIDLSRFAAGTYYISVRNADGAVDNIKVVKN